MAPATTGQSRTCLLIRKIKHLLSREPHFHYTGQWTITDKHNQLKAHIDMGKCTRKSRDKRPNGLHVVIEGAGAEAGSVVGEGLWTRYLRFGDRVYWRVLDEGEKVTELPREQSLPSSAQHREEIELIRQKKFAEADHQLQKIEDADIRDALLRKKKKV